MYRKFLYNGSQLETFQLDLYEPSKFFSKSNFKYILIVIDVVSRFIFTKGIKTKQSSKSTDDIPTAFMYILRQIRALKTDNNIESESYISFYSDLGTEFTSKYMAKLLKSQNCGLLTLGDDWKAGMVERVIRTLTSTAYNMYTHNKKFDIYNDLKDITNNYNIKSHSSLPNKLSPSEFLNKLRNNTINLEKPWNVIETNKTNYKLKFNYDENKKKINKQLLLLKKKFHCFLQ